MPGRLDYVIFSDATLSEVAKLADHKLYYSSNSPAYVRSHSALLALIHSVAAFITFYGGSHRAFADGLARVFRTGVDFERLSRGARETTTRLSLRAHLDGLESVFRSAVE